MSDMWWQIGGGFDWQRDASEILNEQASEEHAHPLTTSDQGHFWPRDRDLLKEQALEDEAQKTASNEVLS
ncbi:hypothetical protein HD554DRAFT_2167313 [Boletus coccyginus]|nr:hypothetical protein HD554DRAFT_2167313 [Boletus coccyginus]